MASEASPLESLQLSQVNILYGLRNNLASPTYRVGKANKFIIICHLSRQIVGGTPYKSPTDCQFQPKNDV